MLLPGAQIEALLPGAKVSFTKFGERYCANDKYFPGPRQMWSNKYDGAMCCPAALLQDPSGLAHAVTTCTLQTLLQNMAACMHAAVLASISGASGLAQRWCLHRAAVRGLQVLIQHLRFNFSNPCAQVARRRQS